MPYFDYNATTPLSPSAREAWLRAADGAWQNPSSLYRSAARARNFLERARAKLAEGLGCDPKRVIFNSGATEGVNAIFDYLASHPDLQTLPVLLSPIEHPCVLAAAEQRCAGRIRYASVDSNGRVEPDAIAAKLRDERFGLVSVMAANNETGLIQPWRETGEVCAEAGVLFHCDAAQWAGKRPLNGLGRHGFITASAHKFGGPKGCGFLVAPPNASAFHGQTGGEQEHGLRAGTEDYLSIAAMLAALGECEGHLQDANKVAQRLAWQEEFQQAILRRIPGTRLPGHGSERLWNTVSLVLPVGENERWVRKLDRAGFEVSTGAACSSGKEAPSHVLGAIGFSREESKRAIRISSGWQTTEADWNDLADALETVHREIGGDEGDGDRLTEVIRI